MTTLDRKQRWNAARIKAAPKIREIYWCDYWQDAHWPLSWEPWPVIVLSRKNTMNGPCLVVPVSTGAQESNFWACRLSVEIEGDGVTSWAMCNHPATVSPKRFRQFHGDTPLLSKADFNQVQERLMQWLPKPFLRD